MTASSNSRDAPAAAPEQDSSTYAEIESLYRNSPVGLSFVDCDLRYLCVNQALADMNGYSIEEMIGRSYRDLSPETADAAEPFLRELMERGMPIRNLEVRSRPPSDPTAEHVYLLSMDVVRDETGEVIGHVSAIQDVTELREAEKTAAQRLKELELLYAHSAVGLCFMDASLNVIHINPMFARLGRIPIADQVGANVEELLPDDLRTQLIPQLRHVARSESSSATLEIRGRPAGGGPGDCTWLAQTHPERSADGRVSGIVTVLQDITLLAQGRREIQAERDRLVEAQHVARFGSYEWDLIGGDVWWSPELYEIFDESHTYPPSYEGFFERVHPVDRQKVREQLDQTLTGEGTRWVTFRIVRSDASERMLFTAARVERNESGIPARLVGTCQDVTEFDSIGTDRDDPSSS
ncbi:MAG: PAS domain-containing protein [bacterium]|nr:PAS domain-containing protein [bacterium]